jgi:hypothetical protein
VGRAARERNISQRRLDPQGDHTALAEFFGRVIFGFGDQAHSAEGLVIGLIGCITDRKPATIAEAFLLPGQTLAEPLFHILEEERQQWRDRVGKALSYAVEHFSAEEAAELFGIIVKLKKNHEQEGSQKNAWALAAYNDFINQTGSEPSKPQLKEFILARKEKYRQRPDPEDKTGWTRLWKASGLFGLRDR